ncbi:uncharacterized protein PAC_12808 [Phialocephala subalpina]|uniref:Gfd2/YDR514C-like C-terminal domain-containing protein n=1 Tax=Phialocephala subalpina TaxID=576137 RepID=A0A1L7XD07_9HELO|nr:uncharacterized protein PAC_12808 [Phialocephala subalpina]
MPPKKPGEASNGDVLRFLFGFNRGLPDHLIIAIHVSYGGMITKLRPPPFFEFGISVLDLSDIYIVLRKLERKETVTADTIKNLISTRNFCIGSSKKDSSTSNSTSEPKFNFGTSEEVKYEDISRILNEITGQRSFSLAVHSDRKMFKFLEVMDKEPGKREMEEFLDMLGVKLDPCYILDMQSVAKEILGIKHDAALDNLCQMLKLPGENLGVAGNDANFLLRALMKLAHLSSFSGFDKKSNDVKPLRAILSYLAGKLKAEPETEKEGQDDEETQEAASQICVPKKQGKDSVPAPKKDAKDPKPEKTTTAQDSGNYTSEELLDLLEPRIY